MTTKMISENYSLSRDRWNWILTEHYTSEDKDGKDKESTRKSYHSSLGQVANYVMNNGDCVDLDAYIMQAENIRNQIEGLLEVAPN